MNLFLKFKALYTPFRQKIAFFYQHKITKKRYLALFVCSIYAPIVVYTLYEHPKEASLRISALMQNASEVQLPHFARKFVFGAYSYLYKVNQEQMLLPFQQYKCFSQFFTRKIKPRIIPKQQNIILSPCDSKILAFGQITEDSVMSVKGCSYSLGSLLCQQDVKLTKQDIQKLKKNKQNKLYHCILYLAPGDYHRFHSVANYQIIKRKSINGALLSVNEKSLKSGKQIYQSNKRLVLHGKWNQGYLCMVMVGALNVGRIVIKQQLIYGPGEEIGYFNLGSTIVLIFQSPNIEWNIEQSKKVKYGECIGRIKNNQISTKQIIKGG